MKASRLVDLINELIKENGDLEIVMDDNGYGYFEEHSVFDIYSVKVITTGDDKVIVLE